MTFIGTLGHAATDFLGQLGGVVFGQAVHEGFHEDTLGAFGNVHLGVADLDAAFFELVFIVERIPAVTADTVVFPGNEGREAVQLGILHHHLESGALIVTTGEMAVYVLFDDHIAVGLGVGGAIAALSLDRLLGLAAAWGVAIVGYCWEQLFLFKFTHKKYLRGTLVKACPKVVLYRL